MLNCKESSPAFLMLFLQQNFKREEQNFVVMNEINNMSFLTADSKSKMSKVSGEEAHIHQKFYWLTPYFEL